MTLLQLRMYTAAPRFVAAVQDSMSIIPTLCELSRGSINCLYARKLYDVFRRNCIPVDFGFLKQIQADHGCRHDSLDYLVQPPQLLKKFSPIFSLQELAADATDIPDLQTYVTWCTKVGYPVDHATLSQFHINAIGPVMTKIVHRKVYMKSFALFTCYNPEYQSIEIRVTTHPYFYYERYPIKDSLTLYLNDFNQKSTTFFIDGEVEVGRWIHFNTRKGSMAYIGDVYKLQYGCKYNYSPNKEHPHLRFRTKLEFSKEHLMSWIYSFCVRNKIDYSLVPEDFRFTMSCK